MASAPVASVGTNTLQAAVTSLDNSIKGLTTAVQASRVGGGQSGTRGLGLLSNNTWNVGSNFAYGIPVGGVGAPGPGGQPRQPRTRGANGGGAQFTGSQGGGAGSGGQGSQGGSGGQGGTHGPRLGGHTGNGGHSSTSFPRQLIKYGQDKLPDQVVMQTSAYQAAQLSSNSWQTVRDQSFRNNYTAQSTVDAANAYGLLSRQGMSPGSAGFNTQWNYATGTSGLMNPGLSQTQRAAGTASLWQGQTYNKLRGLGINTISSNVKQSPRQVAQQIYKQFPELKSVRNKNQLSATLDDPASGLNQSINAWGLDANTVELVKGELRGMLMAQTAGGTAQTYTSLANQRDSGTAAQKSAANAGLNKLGIGGSLVNTLQNRSGVQRNQDVNINDSFTSGLKTATGALNQFSGAIQGFLNSTGLNSVLGFGGGAGSAMGGFSSGLGAYAAFRGLSTVGGLGRAAGGARGAGGLGRVAAGAGIATVATGGALLFAAGVGNQQYARDKAAVAPFLQWEKTAYHLSSKQQATESGDTFLAHKKTFDQTAGRTTGNDGISGGASAASGGGGSPSGSGAAATGTQGAGKTAAAVISIAEKYIGMPYKWGGNSPQSSFDCSGLMQYAFKQVGVNLPRTAAQQQKVGTDVPLGQVRAGDLMFVGNPAHHVVMCVGNGKCLEAPHTGASVRIRSFSPGEFTNARRILGSVGNMNDATNSNSNTAGSSSSRLSASSFGGDMGNYGSTEEVDALAIGVSSIGAANLTSGVGAGQKSSKNTSNGSSGGSLPTGNLKSWIKSALGILHQDTSANERYVNTMAMHESGGNPRAQNNWDSNAKAGHPSKGIMQTIDSTFSAYAMKGHGNIWNPIDNLLAGIRYEESRYGSLANAPGIRSMANGGAYKGYAVGSTNVDVDQNARIHKGEMIIPAYESDAIRKALAANTPMAGGIGKGKSGPAPVLNFHQGAVVVHVQGAMDASSARDAAQQFMTAIAEDNRITLIAAGT